jgi:molybdopterin-containing oxidoreductase family membrane subunit
MTLLLIARWTLNLQNLITIKHLDNMNKIILVTGSVVGYAVLHRVSLSPGIAASIYERFTS